MIDFLRANARWLAAGLLLTMGSSFGQTYFISLSNTSLREMFGLSHGGLGLVYALATTTSALIMLEFGKLVDRVSTRTAALVVIAGLAAACLAMAGAQTVWMLFGAFLLLRLFGQGMMGHVAMTATGRWFAARRGRAISIVNLGFAAGIALLPAAAVLLMGSVGVRQSWLISAGVLALVLAPVIWLLLSRERVPEGSLRADGAPAPAAKRDWRRRDVVARPVFWALILCVICPAAMMTALFFHQLHLMEVKGWEPGLFAATFSAFALVQVVSGLISGGLIDRYSARHLLVVYQIPMALGLLLLALVGEVWVVLPAMVLFGASAGTDTAVMGALWPELFGTKYLGEIRALTFAGAVLASALSPLVTGYLIDQGVPFPLQLTVMGAVSLGACVAYLLMQGRLAAIANDA